MSQRYGVFRVPFVPLIRLCVGTSKKLDTLCLRASYLPSVFFDVTRLQSDVSHHPTSVLYVLPYKNPCVTVRCTTMRTWASGNPTLLMHALRWRPSRLGYFAINRLFQSCYVWLGVSTSQSLSFPSRKTGAYKIFQQSWPLPRHSYSPLTRRTKIHRIPF